MSDREVPVPVAVRDHVILFNPRNLSGPSCPGN